MGRLHPLELQRLSRQPGGAHQPRELHTACLPALQILLAALLEVPAAAETASPADCALHLAAAEALLQSRHVPTSASLLRPRRPMHMESMHVTLTSRQPVQHLCYSQTTAAALHVASPLQHCSTGGCAPEAQQGQLMRHLVGVHLRSAIAAAASSSDPHRRATACSAPQYLAARMRSESCIRNMQLHMIMRPAASFAGAFLFAGIEWQRMRCVWRPPCCTRHAGPASQ